MNDLPSGFLYRDGEAILQTWLADRWWSRARGLLGRRRLQKNEALLIRPCPSVHGWGMTYPLDLLFLDKHGTILRTTRLFPVGFRICPGAWQTVECALGTIATKELSAGQVLEWRKS